MEILKNGHLPVILRELRKVISDFFASFSLWNSLECGGAKILGRNLSLDGKVNERLSLNTNSLKSKIIRVVHLLSN